MFCTKCGANLPDKVRFCTACGAPIQQQESVPVSPPVPQPQQADAAVKRSKKSVVGVVIALVVILSLVLVGTFAGKYLAQALGGEDHRQLEDEDDEDDEITEPPTQPPREPTPYELVFQENGLPAVDPGITGDNTLSFILQETDGSFCCMTFCYKDNVVTAMTQTNYYSTESLSAGQLRNLINGFENQYFPYVDDTYVFLTTEKLDNYQCCTLRITYFQKPLNEYMTAANGLLIFPGDGKRVYMKDIQDVLLAAGYIQG